MSNNGLCLQSVPSSRIYPSGERAREKKKWYFPFSKLVTRGIGSPWSIYFIKDLKNVDMSGPRYSGWGQNWAYKIWPWFSQQCTFCCLPSNANYRLTDWQNQADRKKDRLTVWEGEKLEADVCKVLFVLPKILSTFIFFVNS